MKEMAIKNPCIGGLSFSAGLVESACECGLRGLGFVVEIFAGAHSNETGSEDHGEEGCGDHEFVHLECSLFLSRSQLLC